MREIRLFINWTVDQATKNGPFIYSMSIPFLSNIPKLKVKSAY